MELWAAGVIFGFISGGTLAYFVGRDTGVEKGKKIACNWLLRNARACEYTAKKGICETDNTMEASMLRSYVEHIKEYNGN